MPAGTVSRAAQGWAAELHGACLQNGVVVAVPGAAGSLGPSAVIPSALTPSQEWLSPSRQHVHANPLWYPVSLATWALSTCLRVAERSHLVSGAGVYAIPQAAGTLEENPPLLVSLGVLPLPV